MYPKFDKRKTKLNEIEWKIKWNQENGNNFRKKMFLKVFNLVSNIYLKRVLPRGK